jgi:hypothetical protein
MKTYNELQEYLTEREKSPEHDKIVRQINDARKKLDAISKKNEKIDSQIKAEQDAEKKKYGEIRSSTLTRHTKQMQVNYKTADKYVELIKDLQTKLYV